MASTKLNRYLSVQRAKGQTPDPMQMSKLLREDASTDRSRRAALIAQPVAEALGPGGAVASLSAPGPTSVDASSLEASAGTTAADISVADNPVTSVGKFIAKGMNVPTVSKEAVKKGVTTLAKGVLSKTMNVPAIPIMMANLVSPYSFAKNLAKMGFNEVSAMVAANDLSNAFGLEAMTEASAVIEGQMSLSQTSHKAQQAYANIMVARDFAKQKGPLALVKNRSALKTSLVTPYHTTEAISDAFGVSLGTAEEGFEAAQGQFGGLSGMEGMGGFAEAGFEAAQGQFGGQHGNEGESFGGSGGNAGGSGPSGSGPGGYGGDGLR